MNTTSKVKSEYEVVIEQHLSSSGSLDFSFGQGSVMDLEVIETSSDDTIVPWVLSDVEWTGVSLGLS